MPAYLNILLPVYNEELRLERGVRGTVEYLDGHEDVSYTLTVVDNASDDATGRIARRLACELPAA
jgi:glycosyltransferase involved in cell wall biosynthesis